jgi:hypothetical protein
VCNDYECCDIYGCWTFEEESDPEEMNCNILNYGCDDEGVCCGDRICYDSECNYWFNESDAGSASVL